MDFIGFEVEDDTAEDDRSIICVERSRDFERKSVNWLRLHNHNYKRITRILTSTTLLSSSHLATGQGEALNYLGRDFGGRVGAQTLAIWRAPYAGFVRPDPRV